MSGSLLSAQLEKLDLFFHRKLREAKVTLNLEDIKQELIQKTAEAVFRKLQREKYGDYHLEALIWLKASDIWKLYVRSLKEAGPRFYPPEIVSQLAADDFVAAYETADWLLSIRSDLGHAKWRILVMHLEGLGYKEISRSCFMTESAVRVMIHRLKRRLQKPF